MGGDITVQSEFGKGTTFSISVSTKTKIAKIDLKKFKVNEKPKDKQSWVPKKIEPLEIVKECD